MSAGRSVFFDASALVKVFTIEDGSEIVKGFFHREPTKYTTPFCFYETLTVLKAKWLYRKTITKVEYIEAARRLTAWYGAATRRIEDLNFEMHSTFADAKRLVEKNTALDLSDAFQILSVKSGFFSPLVGDSRTILVTADESLAAAARDEGLRVWYCVTESAP